MKAARERSFGIFFTTMVLCLCISSAENIHYQRYQDIDLRNKYVLSAVPKKLATFQNQERITCITLCRTRTCDAVYHTPSTGNCVLVAQPIEGQVAYVVHIAEDEDEVYWSALHHEEPSELDVLIIHQDVSSGSADSLFPAASGSLNHNEYNPMAKAYSVADYMEYLRQTDGFFYFKLCYPQSSPTCWYFKQTNNPFTTDTPTGFSLISSPPEHSYYLPGLTGLINDYPNQCLTNGAPGWWFSAGARSFHGGNSMPGVGLTMTNGVVTTEVNLYAVVFN